MRKVILLVLVLSSCSVENTETFNQSYGSVFTRECGRACNGRMALSEWNQGQAIHATCRCIALDAGCVVDAGPLPAERP